MKLKKSERHLFGWLGLLTYFSGASLFLFSHWIRVHTEIGEQHHRFEPWNRVAHTTLTYLIVLSVGYLIKSHVIPALRSKHPRRQATGILILVIFGILLLTALITLYAGEGAVPDAARWFHAIVGLSLPIFVIVHLSQPKSEET